MTARVILLISLALLWGAAGAAAPVVSCTPTRTCDGASNICAAPTAVLMNCSASTADTLADGRTAFHSLEFVHRVTTANGSVAGVSQYGSMPGFPLSIMRGPMAAYVFHTGGTYTWIACATDATGTDVCGSPQTFIITSGDAAYPGAATICGAANSLPVAGSGGCPSGADVVNLTAVYGSADLYQFLQAKWGASKRIMLKALDTFLVGNITNAGSKSAIASYGTGRAIVKWTAGTYPVQINTGENDVRLYGLELNGDNIDNSTMIAFRSDGSIVWHNFFLYDSLVYGLRNVGCVDGVFTGSEGYYVANSQFANMAPTFTGDMFLCGGINNAVFVNTSINQGLLGQQVWRINSVQNIVLAHSTLTGTGLTHKEMTSLRPNDSVETKNVMVWANELNPLEGYTAAQAGSTNTKLQTNDVIYEANYVHSRGTGADKNAFDVIGNRISYRHNVLDLSNTKFTRGFSVRGTGAKFLPNNIWLDNNTIYANRATRTLSPIYVDPTTATTFYARNNLGRCLGGVTCTMIDDANTPDIIVHTNNTGDAGTSTTVATNPLFDATNSYLGFRIGASSPYKNIGTATLPASKYDGRGCLDRQGNVNVGALWPTTYAACPYTKFVRLGAP